VQFDENTLIGLQLLYRPAAYFDNSV